MSVTTKITPLIAGPKKTSPKIVSLFSIRSHSSHFLDGSLDGSVKIEATRPLAYSANIGYVLSVTQAKETMRAKLAVMCVAALMALPPQV